MALADALLEFWGGNRAEWLELKLGCCFAVGFTQLVGLKPLVVDSFRISDQARGPAEFKHIIKRRKRN